VNPESIFSFILWFLSLALLALFYALRNAWPELWRFQFAPEGVPEEGYSDYPELEEAARDRLKRGFITFDLLLTGSLVLAGASGLYFFLCLSRGWIALGMALLITGVLGLLIRSVGERYCFRKCISWPFFIGLANFIITVLSPAVTGYIALVRSLTKQGERTQDGEIIWELERALGEEEREIIEGILDLEETIVREIMVPRIDLVAIEAGTPIREAVNVVLESGHSRIPAYKESIDNIVGVLYVKDLLKSLSKGDWETEIRPLLRPPYFVPETKRASELLREMQRDKVHIAIVVDEYGGTAGIVTIEDILEEIVGEIQDEYDVEEPLLEELRDGEYILDARLSLDDLEDILGFEVDVEGVDTVGGLIYSYLGRVPEKGAKVPLGNFELEVLSVVGRRIKKVAMHRRTSEGKGKNGVKSGCLEESYGCEESEAME